MSEAEESQEERRVRRDLEKRALRSKSEGSLRCRLERILAAGGWCDDDGNTPEKALIQYAAIMTKAVAIAMMAEGNELDDGPGIDSTSLLSVGEAARGLYGLSALLDEGYHLLNELELADEGGAS